MVVLHQIAPPYRLLISFFLLTISNFMVGQDTPIIEGFSLKEPPCHGLRGHVIVEYVVGGTPPYFFSLDGENYSSSDTLKNVSGGEHKIFVKDAKDSISNSDFFMPEPEPFEVQLYAAKNPIKTGETAELTAVVSPPDANIFEISWRPPALIEKHFSFKQSLKIKENTTVAIKVKDINQCEANTQLRVLVDDKTHYEPNVIQPNSIDNSSFTIYTEGGVKKVLSLKVFNRWGNLVFSKENFFPNDPSQGWNGEIAGEIAPIGTYVFVAELLYFDDEHEYINGSILVTQ